MAIETEKKYRLTDEQKQFVSEALEELQAEYKGEDYEENTIFGGGILDSKPAVLRVRKIQNKTVLTYKESLKSEFSVKQRIENETEVSDAGELEKIIENLGFEPRLVYEKSRKTWKFREVEIVLDELPFGWFMEIEGSITAITETEMFLGIENYETEQESYPSLTARLGKRNGNLTEARFS
jgi:adenylate cyclase class 2